MAKLDPREGRTPSDRAEDEQEQRNRQLIELLNELRVALPGVQVLFAFLLAVPFQNRFQQVSTFERDLYFVTLVASAARGSTAAVANSARSTGENRRPVA